MVRDNIRSFFPMESFWNSEGGVGVLKSQLESEKESIKLCRNNCCNNVLFYFQALLEAPDDIFSFKFNPSDPNIIAGGCINGQVLTVIHCIICLKISQNDPVLAASLPFSVCVYNLYVKRS